MMMLTEMIKYMRFADHLMIETMLANDGIPVKATQLFNHVLNAQHIWASRILVTNSLYAVWDEHSSASLTSVSQANFELLMRIVKSIDLNKEVTYTNSVGRFTNVVKDILFHVVNHSTYHRAQIASLLRAANIQPPVTDYIILKREMQL